MPVECDLYISLRLILNSIQMKKNSTITKKQGPNNLDTDFVDDDDALMQVRFSISVGYKMFKVYDF